MTALLLAWDRLKARPAATATAVVAVAIGVALLSVAFGVRKGVESNLRGAGGTCDVIVGPKCGPMELVLGVSLGVTSPQGVVDSGLLEDLLADYRVQTAAPVMIEDDLRGWRIIGTDENHPRFEGVDDFRDYFRTGDRIALVGSDAAAALGLKLGDTFVSTHDKACCGMSYEVVEILEPSDAASNRCIFVPISAAHHEHASESHHIRANAILVTLKTPLDLIPLIREWNDMPAVTAVDPRSEISRITGALGQIEKYIWIGGAFVICLASLSIVAIMFSQANERRRAAAILRALGAHYTTVIMTEILSAAIIAMAGGMLGALGGWLALTIAGLDFTVGREESIVLLLALLFGIMASFATSLQLYRITLDDALRPDR